MSITTRHIADLYLHPLNVRSEPSAEEIALLASSIEQVGLLQNLLGYADPAHPGAIGIVGGGRRLRALQSLPSWADAEIPVEVCAAENVVREWALTENTARQALNPADEIIAYRKMSAEADPDQIAKAFGVSGRYVRHRLKLSHLPDEAIEALRAGQISLDHAAALTHANDDADVIEILPRVIRGDYDLRTPPQIRNALQPDSIPATDRRALFVGLIPYRAAGGEVAESLFFEDARLLDGDLLDRLYKAKLSEAADTLKAETGWSNVVVCYDRYVPYQAYDGMTRLNRVPVELPEADQEELDSLQEAMAEREVSTAECDRLEKLEERAAGYYSDDDLSSGTAFYVVDNTGQLRFHEAYCPRETVDGDGDASSRVEAKAETIPQNLRDDFRVIQTLAVQHALIAFPDLIRALLYLTLCQPIAPYRRPLALSPTAQNIAPSKDSGAIIDERLAQALPQGMDFIGPETLAEVLAMPSDRLDREISIALARTFCRAWEPDLGPLIASETGAHPRDVWTPDAENLFKRLPVGMLDRIWEELVPDDLSDHAKFREMKKAQKAKEWNFLFNDDDTREALGLSREQNRRIDQWVPDDLRWPHMDQSPDEEIVAAPKKRRTKKETAA